MKASGNKVDPARRSLWRVGIRVLLFGTLVLIALSLPIAFGRFPQEPLRRFVEKQLRGTFGSASRIGRLHVVPARLEVEMSDLVLDAPAYRIEAPHVRLKGTLALVLSRQLFLESLEAGDMRVLLRVPSPPVAASSSLDGPILIRHLELTRTTLSYHDPALGGDVILRGIEMRGSIGVGSLDVKASGGVWEGAKPLPLGPAAARLTLSPTLDIDIASFEAAVASSQVRAHGSLGNANKPVAKLDLEADVDLADAAWIPAAPSMRGRLSAAGTVEGEPAALNAKARIEGTGLDVGGWPLDRVQADLEGSSEKADVTLAADLLAGKLAARARLSGAEVDARIDVSGISIARVPMTSGKAPPVAGSLSGTLTGRGDLKGTVEVAANVNGEGTRADKSRYQVAASASGVVRPQDQTIDVSWRTTLDGSGGGSAAPVKSAHLEASGRAQGPLPPAVEGTFHGTAFVGGAESHDLALTGTLRAKGTQAAAELQLQGLGGSASGAVEVNGAVARRLSLHGSEIDLAALGQGAQGHLAFDLDAAGRFDRLSGRGQVRLEELAWRQVDVGVVTLGVEMREGRGELALEVPSFHVTGNGTLVSAPQPQLSATVTLAEAPLAPLSPLVPAANQPLDGRLSGDVRLAVPLSAPSKATVTARIDAVEVVSGRYSARTKQPFTLSVDAGVARLRDLDVEGAGITLGASGQVGLAAAGAVEMSLSAHTDLAQFPAPAPWRISGNADAVIDVTGRVDRPVARGTVTLRGLEATTEGSEAPLLSVAEAEVSLEGERAVLQEFRGDLAGGTLVVGAEIPMGALVRGARAVGPSAQERAELRASWSDVQAERVLRALRPGASQPVQAALSGELRLNGTLGALSELSGSLTTTETRMRLDDREVVVGPASLRLERGRANMDELVVSSDAGQLRTTASVDLTTKALDVRSGGRFELRALSPFLTDAALTGTADVDLSVAGTLDEPRPRGGVRIADATLRVRDIPDALTDIEGRIELDEHGARLEEATASLGGGGINLGGTLRLSGTSISNVEVTLAARDVSLRYPASFKSRVRADLTLKGKAGSLLLAGEVHAERGLYDTDIFLDEQLLAPTLRTTETAPSPLLQTVALDIQASTDNPVLVRNNLAELEASGHLEVRGDLETPAPFGRLEIREGGKVFLQGRDFTINSGSLIYNGTLDPDLAIRAETLIKQVGSEDVQVTVAVDGPLLGPDLTLTSDPSYSERELVSLIATGRRNVALDSSAWIAGEQATALLAGRVTRNVAKGLMELGIDEVDIQPELLAREEDPGARFTFGKQLTPNMKLIYSTALNDAEARFFQAQYRFRLGRELTTNVQRDDMGIYSYGAGQRWRWGGTRRRRSSGLEQEKRKLEEVRFEGELPLPAAELQRSVKARRGKKVNYWNLQDDADRLQRRMLKAGYVEALVSANLDGNVAVFKVRPGAHYRWEIRGIPQPPDLREPISAALAEEEALDRGRKVILEETLKRGYPRARVETKVEKRDGDRTLVFTVDVGTPARITEVRFDGARALSQGRLLEAAGGEAALLLAPEKARERITTAYREAFYLGAEVGEPRVIESEDRSQLRIVVPIREGGRARIASLRFEGNSDNEDEQCLRALTKLETGAEYDKEAVGPAVQRLRDYYLKLGHAAVRVTPRVSAEEQDVALTFRVDGGEAVSIGDVVVRGLRRTRESLVRRQIASTLHEGEPLDPRKLAVAERRLLELGIFRRAIASASGNPATITFDLEEQGPYTLAYEARFSPEERGSGLVDVEVGNLAGRALAVGVRYRQGADVRETRGSLHLPAVARVGDFTASVFRQEEDFTLIQESLGLDAPIPAPFGDSEIQSGFQLQQTLHLKNKLDFLYGYSFKRISSRNTGPVVDIGGVQTSLVRDTRDNALNARQGRFWSVSLELAPRVLGSSLDFFRSFGQAFMAHSLGRSLTWAQGYRLGLANGLDDLRLREVELFATSTELFRAGGPNSLRGYASDSVGPPGPIPGLSVGGEALVVVNQELRYHHPTGLGAAVFYDAGNAFARIKDIDLKLRHSVGFGLRYDSPVGLLRLDVGFPLSPRPTDRSYQWFFSFGQAF